MCLCLGAVGQEGRGGRGQRGRVLVGLEGELRTHPQPPVRPDMGDDFNLQHRGQKNIQSLNLCIRLTLDTSP